MTYIVVFLRVNKWLCRLLIWYYYFYSHCSSGGGDDIDADDDDCNDDDDADDSDDDDDDDDDEVLIIFISVLTVWSLWLIYRNNMRLIRRDSLELHNGKLW